MAEVRRAFQEPPGSGQMVAVADGVYWLRFDLPFALNHVHLWALEDGDGWTIVDAGFADEPSRQVWRGLLEGPLGAKPIQRLIVTHFHPDHVGLAGWLCERTCAELWMPPTEWLTARLLSIDTSGDLTETTVDFYRRAGLPADLVETFRRAGNVYRGRVSVTPARFVPLRHGQEVVIGCNPWRVITGAGHSPDLAMLHCPALGLLISGDHVLPRISPNVAVWPSAPDDDPLAHYLSSFDALAEVSADTLVLPSHDWPFFGLHPRIADLRHHHQRRLDDLTEACRKPSTVYELLPVLFDRTLDQHQIRFAVGEALSHLNFLVNTKNVSRLDADADEPMVFSS
ncbi:MAG: MBL fold metallo-hydrolase [Geminicoccaceae bacterium]